MLKRISITGPESTGKSSLARQLANHYKTVCVEEYSVEYLEKHGAAYTIEDVKKIAQRQLEKENKRAKDASGLLFCDTDVLVNKIWCEVVFKEVPEWVEQQFEKHRYDLYLLCSPDIKWEEGPFRENPLNRDELFILYKNELDRVKANYRVVEGTGLKRLENAIKFVKKIR
jgi:NadR type nicotinamide-nucleotide adenylyltransferase